MADRQRDACLDEPVETQQLVNAYELAAASLRSSPGNLRDAFNFAALELGETDDEIDELNDEMWDGMFDRLEEFEVVDSWREVLLGDGSVRLGVLRLAPESIWIVRIDNPSEDAEFHAVREFESEVAARAAIPEITDFGFDIELTAYDAARTVAEMKRRAGRLDQSDAAFLDDLHHGRIDASQLEADDS